MLRALVLGCLLAFAIALDARDLRQRDRFKKDNPCPVTGKVRGACPGWVVDHIIPLCAGGPDAPDNMQWLRVEDARVKDREAVAHCRELRRRQRLPSSS